MPRYTVLDFRDIRDALGDHYNPALRDEYEGVCEACQESVSQRDNVCPVCDTPVVWYNSKVWKALYGNPDAYIRLLSVVEPEDNAGKRLCRIAGVAGFANQTEAERWARAARKLGEQGMQKVVDIATKKNFRGRGLIAYALNLADKIAREKEPAPKKWTPNPALSGKEPKVNF